MQIKASFLGDLIHFQVIKHHLYTEGIEIFIFSLDLLSELQSHP